MKKSTNEKKLSLNKVKISKITNLRAIKGGDTEVIDKNKCVFPEYGSKQRDTVIRI